MNPLRIGVVGCGAICGIYGQNLGRFSGVEIVACADLDHEKAKQFGQGDPMTVDELLASADVDLVLNLTIPAAHHEVALRAVRNGKHVYNEKPLGLTFAQAKELMDAAAHHGVRVGCAPDTFLGASHQECRAQLDAGLIGRPLAGTAFMLCPGHESWHPSPAFYYQQGGGPMLDMGPYYVTALVNLLGPVKAVAGMHQISFPTRTITSKPLHGQVIDVEVPTHIVGILKFRSGPIVTLTTSFEVRAHSLPHIELYGTEGSLQVPDPNGFGGTPKVWTREEPEWRPLPSSRPFAENSRGIGVAQMARAMSTGGGTIPSGELATHVLEIMECIEEAGRDGRQRELQSTLDRPAMLTDASEYETLGTA